MSNGKQSDIGELVQFIQKTAARLRGRSDPAPDLTLPEKPKAAFADSPGE